MRHQENLKIPKVFYSVHTETVQWIGRKTDIVQLFLAISLSLPLLNTHIYTTWLPSYLWVWPLSIKRFLVQFLREATFCARVVWFVISGWILERRGPRALTLIITLHPWGGTLEWRQCSSHFYQVRLGDWAHPVPCQWPFPFKERFPRTLGHRD